MTNEVQIWKPSSFNGSDLLPVAAGQHKTGALIGREHVEAEDIIIPTLKLLQGTSEEVKKGIEGARAGLFWLSGIEQAFQPPIRLLAVAHTKSRSLFPKPDREEHAGLEECLSRDGVEGSRYGYCNQCHHKDWDNQTNRPPACSESHNFTVLTPYGPALMRFQRTSIKAARKFLTTWMGTSDNLWCHPLIVTTTTRTDKVNGRDSTTHVMETRWAIKEDVPPHIQQFAQALAQQINTAHEQGKFFGDDGGDES